MTLRVFISSVQTEFAEERKELREYLSCDPLLRRFFEPFIFEDVPAADRRADEIYLGKVQECDIYLGLFGCQYGREDATGKSATHQEFDEATRRHKERLIFIKGGDRTARELKMQALIRQVEAELVRKRFADLSELKAGVYAALIQCLGDRGLLHTKPFDDSVCPGATLEDLNHERMKWFLRQAGATRNFPLPETTSPAELLTHLGLLENGVPKNAAVLLFGKEPQRFHRTSEVKCAHFHGVQKTKPIPSYQIYKGTVFELVDQAVDFVLSKINLRIGTRAESTQVPTEYEIPQAVVREAIVNAVAHRDYRTNDSVEVILYADRLEISNPGRLPPTLTVADLRRPHRSLPANPLLADPLYHAGYIEKLGTGIPDMIQRCKVAGVSEPEFIVYNGFTTTIRRTVVAPQVTPQDTLQVTPQQAPQVAEEVKRLVLSLQGEMERVKIQEELNLSDRQNFRTLYLLPALEQDYVEMTIPDRPHSKSQKYRLTAKGRALKAQLEKP
ncbi:DUF4062 domain-containing protein [candidate division KSB1 bacterium]|nr:DUF4062 domain-containing protein [candidate division KSB1 bacterium]